MIRRRAFVAGAGAFLQAARTGSAAGRAYPAGVQRRIRLAIAGGGFGASFHWHEHPNCDVVAVTDLAPDRRDRLRQAYRCDNVYDSLEQLLSREKRLDAVAVFTGPLDHCAHASLCFDRGLHVFLHARQCPLSKKHCN